MADNESKSQPVRTLSVKNFSVINEAEIEFGRITLLIGPQSSGKSVLSKLAYFAVEVVNIASQSLSDLAHLSKFQSTIKEEFQAYFPPTTWGSKAFEFQFKQGDYHIAISRRSSQKQISSKLNLSLSKPFREAYQEAFASLSSKRGSDSAQRQTLLFLPDRTLRVVEGTLGRGAATSQTFIPAGRAFFTSFGKAIVAFEESASLDPLTLRFGRLMRWENPLKATRSSLIRERGLQDLIPSVDREIANLLGGSVMFERNRPYFASKDGRRLPLSWLSSGQQELLPLLTTLRQRSTYTFPQNLFVEEPEAHIFPSAQKDLVSLITRIAEHPKLQASMVMTTHSPYILTAFNNLLLAGQLANTNPGLRPEIAKIVPEALWIGNNALRAYCIEDGAVKPINSESGLIDGEYLDSVSEVIGDQFDSLLKLEYDHTKAS
jgi:energy-coupling factor transporter ATP-binding protein EcfA2